MKNKMIFGNPPFLFRCLRNLNQPVIRFQLFRFVWWSPDGAVHQCSCTKSWAKRIRIVFTIVLGSIFSLTSFIICITNIVLLLFITSTCMPCFRIRHLFFPKIPTVASRGLIKYFKRKLIESFPCPYIY